MVQALVDVNWILFNKNTLLYSLTPMINNNPSVMTQPQDSFFLSDTSRYSEPIVSQKTKKIFSLMSIVALRAKDQEAFDLLNKVSELPQVIVMQNNNYYNPPFPFFNNRNEITLIESHIILIVKESIVYKGRLPKKIVLMDAYDRLRRKRTLAISIVASGFDCEILTKNDLLKAGIDFTRIDSARQLVVSPYSNIKKLVTNVKKVPHRIMPINVKTSNLTIDIPLGKSISNNQIVGITGLLNRVTLVAGNERQLMVGSIQYLVNNLLNKGKKVIIIDTDNEFSGLDLAITDKSKKIYQLGINFFINLFSVDTPDVPEESSRINYQAIAIISNLVNALESLEVKRGYGYIVSKFIEGKNNSQQRMETLNDLENFLDNGASVSFDLTNNQSMAILSEIKQINGFSELNYEGYDSHFDQSLIMDDLTIFQFPLQGYLCKKLAIGFLLQKIAHRCNQDFVVVLTESELIFKVPRKTADYSDRAYLEAIGQNYHRIVKKSSLVLMTSNPSIIRQEITRDLAHAIYFGLSNENLQWAIKKHGIVTSTNKQQLAFFQTKESEGILIQAENPGIISQFIPSVLEPIILEPIIKPKTQKKISFITKLNHKSLTILLALLDVLRERNNVFEHNIDEVLKEKSITYDQVAWSLLIDPTIKNPFIKVVAKEGSRIIEITSKGEEFINNQLAKIKNFDAGRIEINKISNYITNIEKKIEYLDSFDFNTKLSLTNDILSLAGGLIKTVTNLDESSIDWEAYSNYLQLATLEGSSQVIFDRRFDLLMRIVDNCIIRLKRLSSNGNNHSLKITESNFIEEDSSKNFIDNIGNVKLHYPRNSFIDILLQLKR